jgi:hypothetical protein
MLAAELLEHIAARTLGPPQPGEALLFDDQYASSGGQMVDLIMGRSRMVCDVRPLFHAIRELESPGLQRGLEAKAYDLGGALAARQAGVVITDGWGRPLQAPLDVHTGASWIGYANDTLRKQIEPVIQEWLIAKGLQPGSG